MKTFNISLVLSLVISISVCSFTSAQESDSAETRTGWVQIGENFNPDHSLSSEAATRIYQSLNTADTVALNFKGKVASVCKVKGCWMELELQDGQNAKITFKDYGFFVPTDLVGKEVLVNGQATISEVDEKTRKHYAEDAGLSEREINNITGSAKTYSMVASGVIIPN